MRNVRAVAMIAVSVCLATAAVYFAWRYIGSKTQVGPNAVAVAVATRDIDIGMRLSPDMIQMVQWPKESVPDGAFQAVGSLLKDAQSQEPRVTRISLQRGEPILESRLAPIGSKGGLSAVIDAGKRAITVRVNDVVGVAGFALPGNYVDVLVNTTKTASSQPENSISKIVLEHILVLAAAQEVNRDETKPKVVNAVTLEVTPDQAERIDLARSVGTLSLVLRNPVDGDAVASLGVTKQQLLDPAAQLGAPPPTAVVHARRIAPTGPPADRIEVIRGTQRNAQEF